MKTIYWICIVGLILLVTVILIIVLTPNNKENLKLGDSNGPSGQTGSIYLPETPIYFYIKVTDNSTDNPLDSSNTTWVLDSSNGEGGEVIVSELAFDPDDPTIPTPDDTQVWYYDSNSGQVIAKNTTLALESNATTTGYGKEGLQQATITLQPMQTGSVYQHFTFVEDIDLDSDPDTDITIQKDCTQDTGVVFQMKRDPIPYFMILGDSSDNDTKNIRIVSSWSTYSKTVDNGAMQTSYLFQRCLLPEESCSFAEGWVSAISNAFVPNFNNVFIGTYNSGSSLSCPPSLISNTSTTKDSFSYSAANFDLTPTNSMLQSVIGAMCSFGDNDGDKDPSCSTFADALSVLSGYAATAVCFYKCLQSRSLQCEVMLADVGRFPNNFSDSAKCFYDMPSYCINKCANSALLEFKLTYTNAIDTSKSEDGATQYLSNLNSITFGTTPTCEYFQQPYDGNAYMKISFPFSSGKDIKLAWTAVAKLMSTSQSIKGSVSFPISGTIEIVVPITCNDTKDGYIIGLSNVDITSADDFTSGTYLDYSLTLDEITLDQYMKHWVVDAATSSGGGLSNDITMLITAICSSVGAMEELFSLMKNDVDVVGDLNTMMYTNLLTCLYRSYEYVLGNKYDKNDLPGARIGFPISDITSFLGCPLPSEGCTDPVCSVNFNSDATCPNGSCIPIIAPLQNKVPDLNTSVSGVYGYTLKGVPAVATSPNKEAPYSTTCEASTGSAVITVLNLPISGSTPVTDINDDNYGGDDGLLSVISQLNSQTPDEDLVGYSIQPIPLTSQEIALGYKAKYVGYPVTLSNWTSKKVFTIPSLGPEDKGPSAWFFIKNNSVITNDSSVAGCPDNSTNYGSTDYTKNLSTDTITYKKSDGIGIMEQAYVDDNSQILPDPSSGQSAICSPCTDTNFSTGLEQCQSYCNNDSEFEPCIGLVYTGGEDDSNRETSECILLNTYGSSNPKELLYNNKTGDSTAVTYLKDSKNFAGYDMTDFGTNIRYTITRNGLKDSSISDITTDTNVLIGNPQNNLKMSVDFGPSGLNAADQCQAACDRRSDCEGFLLSDGTTCTLYKDLSGENVEPSSTSTDVFYRKNYAGIDRTGATMKAGTGCLPTLENSECSSETNAITKSYCQDAGYCCQNCEDGINGCTNNFSCKDGARICPIDSGFKSCPDGITSDVRKNWYQYTVPGDLNWGDKCSKGSSPCTK